jgi:hypothetical protein
MSNSFSSLGGHVVLSRRECSLPWYELLGFWDLSWTEISLRIAVRTCLSILASHHFCSSLSSQCNSVLLQSIILRFSLSNTLYLRLGTVCTIASTIREQTKSIGWRELLVSL